jgi:hypothetical protein
VLQTDYSLITYTMDQKIKASLKQAGSRRMLREAGIDPRPWFIRRVRTWLYHLDQVLVALGQRLEHIDASMEGYHLTSRSRG